MKIIHCADLHLDSKMDSSLPQEKSTIMRSSLLVAFRNLLETAKSLDAKAIIIVGDIFDNERMTKTTINYVVESFERYPDINIYIAKGNHSGDALFDKIDNFPKNVFLFGNEWTTYDMDNVAICGIDFMEKTDPSIYNRLNLEKDKFNIVAIHGQESQYESDKTPVINLKALTGRNIDYLAMGHIHSYKAAKLDDRGTYCYSGCLAGRGFDELGSKGYVIIDTDNQTHSFVPLDQREFSVCQADITGLHSLKEIETAVMKATENIPERNLVKLVLVGTYKADTQKDITTLQKMLDGKFFFAKIYDKTNMEINIEDFKNDISLKGEFIRHILSDTTLTDKQKSDIIFYGIRALYGEELD